MILLVADLDCGIEDCIAIKVMAVAVVLESGTVGDCGQEWTGVVIFAHVEILPVLGCSGGPHKKGCGWV